MGGAKILHISDLHFGTEGQASIWNSLKAFVTSDLKPDLVVVTGDIVDSPSRKEFARAKSEIDSMTVNVPNKYIVCAGNHDRHWRGNAFGKFQKTIDIFRGPNSAGAWFDQTFTGTVASIVKPIDLSLSSGTYNWKIRIVGFDSSIDAKYSAQGFVNMEALQNLHAISRTTDEADLLVLLIHHHLLPISSLDSPHQSSSRLFQPTTILNAGSVLEGITSAHVNLVLHGHEHRRNIARYGTCSGQHGEVVVLSAGSAAGAITLKPCSQNIASSNVIELRDDQTIWAKELAYQGGHWQVRDETAVQLLSYETLRKGKFFRRTDSAKTPPTSELSKHITFNRLRDMVIQERWTDWLITDPEFTVRASNSTGYLANPEVRMQLPQSVAIRSNSTSFQPVKGKSTAYVYRTILDATKPVLSPQIDIKFEWLAGSVLCKEDLDLIDPKTLDALRRDGYEFTGVAVTSDLRKLSIHVQLPDEFWPEEGVKVFSRDIKKNEPPTFRPHLTDLLRIDGLGHYSFTLPYPITHTTYFLAWKVPSAPATSLETLKLADAASQKGSLLAARFWETLNAAGWGGDCSVAIYLPEVGVEASIKSLQNFAVHSGNGNRAKPPKSVSLMGAGSIYRRAWWGEIGIVGADGIESDAERLAQGLADGEKWAIAVPLRSLNSKRGASPAGVVRVGVVDKSTVIAFANSVEIGKAYDLLARGILSMLNAALNE